jgi:pimeloyl-ACP methyl ester carboxylesterase
MPIDIHERSFDTGVVTINYAEGPPSGPPLVLLHGGSARWQSFEVIIPDLATRWHLYAPDFRGHGKSGRVPGSYRFQDYADDTIAFLRQRITEPALLFGQSLGGMIVLLVAAQCPDRVRAVVVGDAPLTRETLHVQLSRERLAAWRDLAGGRLSMDEIAEALKDTPVEVPGKATPVPMREARGEDAPVFSWLATNLYYNDPDMITALLDGFETTVAGYEMDEVLPAIRCPVLLLQADPDWGGMMTDAGAERALALLAQPRHVRLEQIDHPLFNEKKEPALRAIVDFFESLV